MPADTRQVLSAYLDVIARIRATVAGTREMRCASAVPRHHAACGATLHPP